MPYPVVETPARPQRRPHERISPAADPALVAERCGCECRAHGCVSLATDHDSTSGREYESADLTAAAVEAETSPQVRPVYPVVEWFGGVES